MFSSPVITSSRSNHVKNEWEPQTRWPAIMISEQISISYTENLQRSCDKWMRDWQRLHEWGVHEWISCSYIENMHQSCDKWANERPICEQASSLDVTIQIYMSCVVQRKIGGKKITVLPSHNKAYFTHHYHMYHIHIQIRTTWTGPYLSC